MGKKKKAGIIPWHLPSYLSKHRGKSSSHGGGGGWLLSACRYPRTASFASGRGGDGKQQGEFEKAATMDDINRFLCENFSSLYDGSVEDEDSGELVATCCSSGADGDVSPLARATGDDEDDHNGGRGGPCEIVLASASASQRFFASSLGKKSSSIRIMDDDTNGTGAPTTTGRPTADDYASSTTTTMMTASVSSASSCSPDCQRDTSTTADAGIPDDGVAVVTFSKVPQDDFLRSMEEMLDAHLSCQLQQSPALVDWGFMQDLLLCYLHLNDASVHGHILQAFADLVAELRTRKDVVLSEEPGRADDDTDPTKEVCDYEDDDGVAPGVHGAVFSYSRY